MNGVLIFLIFIAGVIFAYRILFWVYTEPDMPDELHFVETRDKVRIILHRYLPKGNEPHGEPVFFCHGLGANKYNLDFDSRYSLARFFSERGYDSWIISLRGAESWSTKGLTGKVSWDFDFDTFVEQDIPCSIEYILSKTGKKKIHWIGHSMGGMLLYAFVIRWGNERIASGITLGSPVRFSSADRHIKIIAGSDFFLKNFRVLHLNLLAKVTAPLTGIFKTRLITHQMNPKNVDFKLIRRAQFNAVTPISTKLLRQFQIWVKNDEFKSLKNGLNYRENLDKIKIPVLVVAGKKDKMARLKDVQFAYERISSGDKKYIELSREGGFSEDYGHIDMVFGKVAPEEVFPLLLDWIDSHRG